MDLLIMLVVIIVLMLVIYLGFELDRPFLAVFIALVMLYFLTYLISDDIERFFEINGVKFEED